MTDAISTARYDGQQARRILADLTHLEQLASRDPDGGHRTGTPRAEPGCEMDLFLMRLFQRQVIDQCRMVLVAAQLLNEGLTLLQGLGAEDWDTHEEGIGRVWIALPMMLTGAANISKALWGHAGRATTARQVLRQSLDVQDTSPLRDVGMRNYLEHFDERLDRWYAKSVHRNYLDRMVGPPSTIQGFAQSDMFRVFDHTTLEMVFWGERFNIQELVTEAQRILPLAQAEADKPHTEP